MRAQNNTWDHYQDNHVETWLAPDRAQLTELANAGVVALLFGRGADGVTCDCDAAGDGVTNPTPIGGNTRDSLAADDDGGFFREQLLRFRAAVGALRARFPGAAVHAANSAATLRARDGVDARFDLVRCGIEVYGLSPAPELGERVRAVLRPALALRTLVGAVRVVEAGEKVSYGHIWTAPRRTRVATLPLGYADGIRRALSNRMRVVIDGRAYPQVGRVTMDQLMVDLGDAGLPGGTDDGPVVQVGAVATLLGDPGRGEPGVAEWAGLLDTIDYEISCGLAARVPRVHLCTGGGAAPRR
jgi:alanine racemase